MPESGQRLNRPLRCAEDYGLGMFQGVPLVLVGHGPCYHRTGHGVMSGTATFTEDFARDGMELRACRLCWPTKGLARVNAWVESERMAVAVAANQWAEAHGIARRVTVEHVESVESMAMGHVDYASKLALYVSDLVLGMVPHA